MILQSTSINLGAFGKTITNIFEWNTKKKKNNI